MINYIVGSYFFFPQTNQETSDSGLNILIWAKKGPGVGWSNELDVIICHRIQRGESFNCLSLNIFFLKNKPSHFPGYCPGDNVWHHCHSNQVTDKMGWQPPGWTQHECRWDQLGDGLLDIVRLKNRYQNFSQYIYRLDKTQRKASELWFCSPSTFSPRCSPDYDQKPNDMSSLTVYVSLSRSGVIMIKNLQIVTKI